MTAKPSHGITWVVAIAAAVLLAHLATNHRYGFHRDELQLVDDARPRIPSRGPTPWGIRVPAALAQSLIIVLAGLMARDLGGGWEAPVLAAAMTAIAPVAVIQGALPSCFSLRCGGLLMPWPELWKRGRSFG